MVKPIWRTLPGPGPDGKRKQALQEAQQLARYIYGPHWGEQHDAAVENYLKQNGFD